MAQVNGTNDTAVAASGDDTPGSIVLDKANKTSDSGTPSGKDVSNKDVVIAGEEQTESAEQHQSETAQPQTAQLQQSQTTQSQQPQTAQPQQPKQDQVSASSEEPLQSNHNNTTSTNTTPSQELKRKRQELDTSASQPTTKIPKPQSALEPITQAVRHLVIVPAGDTSMHMDSKLPWIDPNAPNRNFDLHVIYYGDDDEVAAKYKRNATFFTRDKGPKWQLLRKVLVTGVWKSYTYVWLPDDDLKIGCKAICRMFDVANKHLLFLGQPALEDFNVQPAYRDLIVKRRGLALHYTNFVEIMCPFFHHEAMGFLLPTIDDDNVKSGWGLDYLWPIRLDFRDIAVVDCTPVLHTRAQNAFTGGESQTSFYRKYNIDPQRECFDLMVKHRFQEYRKRSFREVPL